ALFPASISGVTAALFLGAAMSVTAFPVLSRIVHERGLTTTWLGTLALAAGSIDDAIAWCLLAILLATISGMSSGALLAIGGGLAYVTAAMWIGRPLWHRMDVAAKRAPHVSGALLALTLGILMVGAWFTDMVGIHAVFGAFVFGAALPR